jgi:hypothetical protein
MAQSPSAPGWGPESESSTPRPESAQRAANGIRFTIGSMLWITGGAAVIIAALFAFPPVISAAIASLMSICIPSMLVGCLIYGGPAWKAFAVGALLPTVMRLVTGLFSRSAGMSGLAMSNMSLQRQLIQQQMLQQQMQGVRSGLNSYGSTTNSFTYFGQLAEVWDRVGQAYMTEETLFWGASVIAGLATLFVQRRFAQAAPASTKKIGGLAA